MITLENITEYSLSKPSGWSVFGSVEDFDQLPSEHRDQILFLNRQANNYLYEYLEASKLLTGPIWDPFQQGNFKTVDEFTDLEDEKKLKKWLYQRGIPFSRWVFLLPNYSEDPIYLTWKMVIKYSWDVFWGVSDVVLFDETNNWCLFYFHEEHLFFGKDNVFDPEVGYQNTHNLYELKRKYPHFKNPILPD